MLRFLADENLNGKIVRAVQAQGVDLIRVQDTEIYEAPDPAVLQWAAEQSRILLTHDIKTMPKYAHERVNAGFVMKGVICAAQELPLGMVIEQLLTIAGASDATEWESLVTFLPL